MTSLLLCLASSLDVSLASRSSVTQKAEPHTPSSRPSGGSHGSGGGARARADATNAALDATSGAADAAPSSGGFGSSTPPPPSPTAPSAAQPRSNRRPNARAGHAGPDDTPAKTASVSGATSAKFDRYS